MSRGKSVDDKLELSECVSGSYLANKKCSLNQPSISCLLSIVKVDTFLQNFFSIHPNGWDKCYNCELENLGQLYYNLLYIENIPHNITNLLYGQKAFILLATRQ